MQRKSEPGTVLKPLSEVTRGLVDVCMGREPADLIVIGGRLVNVHTREVLDGVDVAIKDGRVAMFGDAPHTRGAETEILDAEGAYLVPGLIDTHLHIESSMATVARFAEAVLPHGTTTAAIDNHEMANVFGLEGIRWMLDEARGLQLRVLLQVPSCVPALPGFEDAGAVIGVDEIRNALQWPETVALGEMMNMPGVIHSDEGVHAEIAVTLEARRPVTGHWSLTGWRDHRLQAYAAAGIDADHETIEPEDALAKLRAGIWVQFRESTAWRSVADLVRVITEDGVDPRHCLLCTDDVEPETLVAEGHMDRALRVATGAGLDPLIAIQLATLNPAEYLGLRQELGSIAPGRVADVLFVEDLHAFEPHRVLVAGRALGEVPARSYPPEAYASIRIPSLDRDSLRVEAAGTTTKLRAIGMVSGVLATEHLVVEAPIVEGEVRASVELDLAKAASIERHGGAGTIGLGFVHGLGLREGAVATSVAHDNHNLMVVGMDDDDMLFACERLRAAGGGMIAVARGEVLGFVELPIAGLMSDRPVAEVAEQVRGLGEAYRRLGSTLESPFLFVSLLSLGVIPTLRLTNRGLVDGVEFRLVPTLVT
jgi:adenine deaminase